MASIETAMIHFTQTISTIKKILNVKEMVTSEIARILVDNRIPLPRFQSMICGPITGCASIFRKNLGELFAKQKDARMKKTSPGIIGRIKPAIPIPENRNPKAIQTGLGRDIRDKREPKDCIQAKVGGNSADRM